MTHDHDDDDEPIPPPRGLDIAMLRALGRDGGATLPGLVRHAVGLLLIAIEARDVPPPRADRNCRGEVTLRWFGLDAIVEASASASGEVRLWHYDRGRLAERTVALTPGRAVEPLRRMLHATFGDRFGVHPAAAMIEAMTGRDDT